MIKIPKGQERKEHETIFIGCMYSFIILGEEDSDFYKSEMNSPLCVIKVLSRLQINFFK